MRAQNSLLGYSRPRMALPGWLQHTSQFGLQMREFALRIWQLFGSACQFLISKMKKRNAIAIHSRRRCPSLSHPTSRIGSVKMVPSLYDRPHWPWTCCLWWKLPRRCHSSSGWKCLTKSVPRQILSDCELHLDLILWYNPRNSPFHHPLILSPFYSHQIRLVSSIAMPILNLSNAFYSFKLNSKTVIMPSGIVPVQLYLFGREDSKYGNDKMYVIVGIKGFAVLSMIFYSFLCQFKNAINSQITS